MTLIKHDECWYDGQRDWYSDRRASTWTANANVGADRICELAFKGNVGWRHLLTQRQCICSGRLLRAPCHFIQPIHIHVGFRFLELLQSLVISLCYMALAGRDAHHHRPVGVACCLFQQCLSASLWLKLRCCRLHAEIKALFILHYCRSKFVSVKSWNVFKLQDSKWVLTSLEWA